MSSPASDYSFRQIEQRWQQYWDEQKTFKADTFSPKPKYYILDMFPYPSGAGLHVGHPEGYTASDILCRYKVAKGFNVLHPMGWDAFGLPAEQYAIQTGTHPSVTTRANIENFRRQIKSIGFAIDWDREINTTDPAYFKWTQWIFLQLFRHGLAYVDDRPVWFCPALGTVLANEEVLNTPEGPRSERGSHPVERRPLRQWVLRITAYADRLLSGLDSVDWPDSTKRLQANWIGRSEGAEVLFDVQGHAGESLRVYTTRPDTLFGATYMVLAPEHPLVARITTPAQRGAVDAYVRQAASKSDLERAELAKDKTGVFTGAYAINPVNGKAIPVWISDYVLMGYGTGAIMAVPAHDERDHAFAEKFGLPIIQVVQPPEGQDWKGFCDDGTAVNSSNETISLDGLPTPEAKARITAWLDAQGRGRKAVNYKLRDWLFSRQRYWGEPFPILWVAPADYARIAAGPLGAQLPKEPVTCSMDGRTWNAVALPPSALPLRLPETETYQPSPTGESPLSRCGDWVSVWLDTATGETRPASDACPGPAWVRAERETNTMPQWAGSCWYYLRYCDPRNDLALIAPEVERYWGAPDFYIGGAEHAVLHLLYARFWHQFLFDIGVLSTPEPFLKLFHQGLILGFAYERADGSMVPANAVSQKGDEWIETATGTPVRQIVSKMSKSLGNVVNPDDVIAQYGADTLRLYEMFMGPLADMKPWNMNNVNGVHRFLRKVWMEFAGVEQGHSAKVVPGFADDPAVVRELHLTIRKVGEDIERLAFNTAISQMMVFMNLVQTAKSVSLETARTFTQVLAPFAPHLGEELWARLGGTGSVAHAAWPKYDPAKLESDTVTMGVQVNGKVRGELTLPKTSDQEAALTAARAIPTVAAHLDGKTVRKVVFVPGKILNIVVG